MEYDVTDEPEASAVRGGQCRAIRAALAWVVQHPADAAGHSETAPLDSPDAHGDLRRAA